MKRWLLLSLLGSASGIQAHPGEHEGPHPVSATSQATGVRIVEQDGLRRIESNGLPDHEPGRFPNRGNPNRIAAQQYRFQMTLQPQQGPQATPSQGGWFGVAVNGVPFEPGTAEFWNGDRGWNYEAKSGKINLGLDQHNAHVQPTGAYHYHGLPTGLLDASVEGMQLIGWAADGFPIYGPQGPQDPMDAESPMVKLKSSYRLKSGTRPGGPEGAYDGTFTADYEYVAGAGDLDECNGRFGVTPEHPEGIYYYVITDEFPHVGRFWKGEPDSSFMKRRGGPGMGPRGPGGPPRGGAGKGRPPGGPKGDRPPPPPR